MGGLWIAPVKAEPARYCVTLAVDSANKRLLGAWFLPH